MATDSEFIESLRMIKVCLIGSNTEKEQALLISQSEIELYVVPVDDFDVMLNKVCDIYPDILILSDAGNQVPADELCMHTYLRNPDIKTLIISEQEADYQRLEATGFSCKGFILHDQRHAIVRAVKVINDGEAWLTRKLVSTVLDQLAGRSLAAQRKPQLVKNN